MAQRGWKKLLATRALRNFGFGYLIVAMGLYLDKLGFNPVQVGAIVAGTTVGSTVMTVLWSITADRYGRRRTVGTMSLLMILGGLMFAFGDNFWLLMAATFTGTISAAGSELGSFSTVEQAILPQTAPDERRTWLFSIYNTMANLAGAFGSLFSASVGLFAALGLTGADAYRPLFLLYAGIGVANLLLFITLSDKVELARVNGRARYFGIHRSRRTVLGLSLLFGLDAFGGGFVFQPILAYWFHLRWGLPAEILAVCFFWTGLLSCVSLLAADWLSKRIGLLNTMVFTHAPANLMLMLMPLAPTAWLALGLLLLRASTNQMDIPARQSYTMAVVDPDERTATAGITSVARTAASAVSPMLSGWAFSMAALGAPFFVGGVLKILYDALLWKAFRNLRPPEEQAARQGA